MTLIVFWLALAALVAIFADSRGRSGFGFFLLSIFLSPLIGLIIVLVVPNKTEQEAEEKRRAEDHERQLESIKALHRGTPLTPGSSVADELTKLANLRDKGLLSDAEFQTQKANLLATSNT